MYALQFDYFYTSIPFLLLEDVVCRPLTIVKCHTDLLKLANQEMATSDAKTAQMECENQLSEVALEMTQNAIECAIIDLQLTCPSSTSSIADNVIDVQNEMVGDKLRERKDEGVTLLHDSGNPETENLSIVDKQECGDMIHPPCSYVSEETNAECSSQPVGEMDNALGMNTTASQLTSDSFYDKIIPKITLTSPEGRPQLIFAHSLVNSTVQSTQALAESCPPNISLDHQITGVSQTSLTRDDTLNSSMSEPQVGSKMFGEKSCEQTESSGKEVGFKDDTSDKSSLCGKLSSCPLNDQCSELSLSLSSQLEKERGEGTAIVQPIKEKAVSFNEYVHCADSKVEELTADLKTCKVEKYIQGNSDIGCNNNVHNTSTQTSKTSSGDHVVGDDMPLPKQNEPDACVNSPSGICPSQPEICASVEEEFLLAEAEAVFLAQLEENEFSSATAEVEEDNYRANNQNNKATQNVESSFLGRSENVQRSIGSTQFPEVGLQLQSDEINSTSDLNETMLQKSPKKSKPITSGIF